MADDAAALRLEDIGRRFGELHAVQEVSLNVADGSRHAVIGPNGAGKSTLFSLVAGTLAPTSGRVRIFGRDVTRLSDHRRARLGVAKTFQHSSVFASMGVLDNVVLAASRRIGGAGRPWGRHRRPVLDAARDALHRAGLDDRGAEPAGALSHGERRQLEVAIAFAQRPRLMLLDEPTAGMSAAETGRFVQLIENLPAEITVLMIEHDLDVVFSLATEVTVLHLGRLLDSGPPERIRASALVQQTYLGAEPADLPEVRT